MPRPDDGLIHAWLDGQLPPDEAARVAALAATDPEWAAAVAEARGLVAASSRILATLDDVPANVVPNRTAVPRGRRLPWWTKAAAAVVLMGGGSVLVMQRLPDADAPVSTNAAPRPLDVVQAPVAAELPAGTSTAAKRDARPATVTMPQSTPAPAASNAAKPPAPMSVAQDAPRAALAESQGKSAEAVTAAPVTPPVSAMFAETTKDAASEARPAARRVAGVAGVAGAAGGVAGTTVSAAARMTMESKPVACYRLERDRAPVGTIGVMRMVRTDGDTLRLEPAQDPSLLRAWIVWRDGGWRGVAVPIPAGRDTIAVIAARVACPAP